MSVKQEKGDVSEERQKIINQFIVKNSSGKTSKYNLLSRPALKHKNSFLNFYKSLNILSEEDHLNYDLPTSFRINPLSQYSHIIDYFVAGLAEEPSLTDVEVNDVVYHVDPLERIEWYPDPCLSWQYIVGRKALRVSDGTRLLKKFLAYETEIGNIVRQEVVSMIPALFLDVQPHLNILDMCASPGSKTGQILEMMGLADPNPTGILVANDLDIGRIDMMTHRINFFASEALMITNYNAALFPIITYTDNGEDKQLSFDRILCDVPCSGDGTLRKSPSAAKRWHPKNGRSLHPTQLSIAKRGIELLNVGGIMVYSTCSFNPLENEAVVAELLRTYGDSIELVDCTDLYPSMNRYPGVNEWKPMDNKFQFIQSFDDAGQLSEISESMFAPTEEEKLRFPLERCMRFFPHSGNTGGFFVAVVKKLSATKDDMIERYIANDEDEEVQDYTTGTTGGKKDKQTLRKFKHFKMRVIEPEFHQYLKEQAGQFGIDESAVENLVSKSTASGAVFKVNDLVYKIIQYPRERVLRAIYAGYKFIKNDGSTVGNLKIRFSHDGVIKMAPSVTNRLLIIKKKEDFYTLLQMEEPMFYDDLSPDLMSQLDKISPLGFIISIIRLDPEEITEKDKILFSKDLVFGGWKGTVTFRLFINKVKTRSLRNLFLSEKYNHDDETLQHIEQSNTTPTEQIHILN